jgi:HEAT repeat protein
MTRRRLIVGGVLVMAAVLAVLFEPTGVVRGYLCGEPFFDGRPADTWARRLRDASPHTQEDARKALVAGGPAAVPVLLDLLRQPGGWEAAEVRWTAAELLGEIGPAAGPVAADALVTALGDSDRHVRAVATEALGQVGPLSPLVVPALTVRLKDDDPLPALRALARCRPDGLEAVPEVTALLTRTAAAVRWNAARTLGKLGADKALGPLVAALKDEDADVREHAAEALGDIGPAAAAAVEPLTGALRDPNARVRHDAARSLGQIGPAARPAVPALRGLRDDPEPAVREAAARALAALEPPAGK